jgi:hypothetical protein
MASRSTGISGIGLTAITGGLFLIYVGLNNIPVLQAARDVMGGKKPTPNRKQATVAPIDWDSVLAGAVGNREGADTGNIRSESTKGDRPVVVRERAFITQTWKISTGGYRAIGSVANSDHPKGLAIDAMTRNVSLGNAIWFHYQRHPCVTYIIWQRQIWQGGKATPYSGPSPHTDHVHISFRDC